MNRPLSIGLLVVGIVLIGFGINASQSLASEVSKFFSGTPTNESVWLLIGGGLLAALGVGGLLRSRPVIAA